MNNAETVNVWKSDFEAEGDPVFQVSLNAGNNDDSPQILKAYATHQQAWDRAIKEADARKIAAVDEIDDTTYQPE